MRPRSLGKPYAKTLDGTLCETLCGNLMRNLRRTLCGTPCFPNLAKPQTDLRRALCGPQTDLMRLLRGRRPIWVNMGPKLTGADCSLVRILMRNLRRIRLNLMRNNLMRPRIFLRFFSNRILSNLMRKSIPRTKTLGNLSKTLCGFFYDRFFFSTIQYMFSTRIWYMFMLV